MEKSFKSVTLLLNNYEIKGKKFMQAYNKA